MDTIDNAPVGTTPSPSPAPAVESAATTPVASPVQEAPTPASSPAQSVTESEEIIASGGSGESGKRFQLVKDATGRRVVKFATEPSPVVQEPAESQEDVVTEEPAPSIAQDVEDAMNVANKELPKYNLNEFSHAIAMGNVDESRVPAEYSQQYADYKIKQAMEAYNRQQEALNQQKREIEKQLSPEEQALAAKEFYSKLGDNAKERAMKELGLSDEKLEELELLGDDENGTLASYQNSYHWHRQQLINDVQRRLEVERAAKAEQQNIYKGIAEFVNNAKATEPNFNEIDVLMQDRYKTLPYAEGRAAEEAIMALKEGNITAAQTETLRKYYESVRKEYYAAKNNITMTPKPVSKPPVVETSGRGNDLPKDNMVDFKQLRNATNPRERRDWLKSFFVNRGR